MSDHACVREFVRTKHCCVCEDCGRFEREPGWCQRCGAKEEGIGFNNVCSPCATDMGLDGI